MPSAFVMSIVSGSRPMKPRCKRHDKHGVTPYACIPCFGLACSMPRGLFYWPGQRSPCSSHAELHGPKISPVLGCISGNHAGKCRASRESADSGYSHPAWRYSGAWFYRRWSFGAANSLPEGYAIFGEQPPGLVDQCCARLDAALPDTVDALNIGLFRRFMRYETHIGPLHCFIDACRVIGVIFRAEQYALAYRGWMCRTSCPRPSMVLAQYFEGAQAFMPTRQVGRLAKKRTTPTRFKVCLSTGLSLVFTL